ncbi:hypothetical protein Ciccas_000390 [Cichlidogyrus casuarinus]|uniref:Aquaporin n=1 Tax=Cichlidogyrus casuarinus TaxID=1844966 RepID=A0ABD2QN74_9PLAT
MRFEPKVLMRHSEWKQIARACLAEFFGTGLLILFALLMHNKDIYCHIANLSLNIWFTGPVSGGHINPWVTLLFTLQGKVPFVTCVLYILSQILGATTGSAFAIFVLANVYNDERMNSRYHEVGMLRVRPASDIGGTRTDSVYVIYFILEMLAATFFYLTVLSVSDHRRHELRSWDGSCTFLGAFLIGFSLIPGWAICAELTADCVNPIRALGPAIANFQLGKLFVSVFMRNLYLSDLSFF